MTEKKETGRKPVERKEDARKEAERWKGGKDYSKQKPKPTQSTGPRKIDEWKKEK